MKKKMWHCKNCGNLCDTANGVCPECGMDLGFYGEVQFVDVEDAAAPPPPSPPPSPPPQPQPQPQQQEAPPPPPPQQAKPKKQKKVKEPKPPKEGRKGGKLPIIGGAVALIAVLVIGSFALRTRVDSVRVHMIEGWETNNYGGVYYAENSTRGTQEIEVNCKGFLGIQPELKVTSRDSDVVQVSAVNGGDNGAYTVTLRAKSPGTTEIVAHAGGESNSYQVQVYQITGVELSVPEFSDEANLGLGDSISYTAQMECEGTLSEKQLSDVTVTSSDTSVVEVNTSSKELVAKGNGSAVITASAGDYKKSLTVNVFEVTDVELECYDLLTDGNGKTMYWLPEGLTMGVDILYHYNGEMGSTMLPYTLESSNEKVLSVDPDNFTITAVSPGKATVTATMAGHTDSVTLDVYPVDRSSGAWVRSNVESIAAPAAGKTSEKDYSVIIRFGDGVRYVSVPTRCGAGASASSIGDWENISDQYPNEDHEVHSLEMHLTLKSSQWNQKRTIAGIIFMYKRTDADSDYDPSTDIVDYWVIYTE